MSDQVAGIGVSRGWAVYAGLAVVLVAAVWAFASIGFNPTDDGLIVAQASRLLGGGSPHLDVTSPRPLGSPLLHTVDVLLPTPVLFTSRAIALLEFLAIAALSVRLLRAVPMARWGVAEVALTITAFVVNLHTFPLLSWHTVDGLLVGLVALVVVQRGGERGSLRWIAVGAFLAGCAPLIKQSFAPVPVLVAAWVCWQYWPKRDDNDAVGWVKLGAALAVSVVPGLAYVLWVALTSSVSAAMDQMLATSGVNAREGLGASTSVIVFGDLAALALFAIIYWRRRAGSGPDRAPMPPAVRVVVGAVAVLLVGAAIQTTWSGGLLYTETWGETLWWLALFSALVWTVVSEELDVASIALLGFAWMASLSWGYPVPNLMGGSLLMVVLARCGQTLHTVVPSELEPRFRPLAMVGAGLLAVALVTTSLDVRRTTVYRDLPAAEQNVDLGDISHAARGVRTNETTAAYLREIQECMAKYPARHLAVLPDNPVVPLLLSRTNPLPLDWWYPLEIPVDRDRIMRAVEAVDRQGDYLILFQTVRAENLAAGEPLPQAAVGSELFDYGGGMVSDVKEALTGQTVTCGSFVGRYAAE